MEWGFISITISAILIDKIGVQYNLKDVIQVGFWILILYISTMTLYQNYRKTRNQEI